MMDAKMANEARRHGCRECVYYIQSVTVSGRQEYGTCVVDRPRTSGSAQFPVVRGGGFCGSWLPVTRIQEG